LLAAPDDIDREPSRKRRLKKVNGQKPKLPIVDVLETALELAVKMPGLCDPVTGLPKSWYHYVYGVGHLRRSEARDALRMFGAARAAQVDKEHQQEWIDEQTDKARFT
jgi:hypothetical protein